MKRFFIGSVFALATLINQNISAKGQIEKFTVCAIGTIISPSAKCLSPCNSTCYEKNLINIDNKNNWHACRVDDEDCKQRCPFGICTCSCKPIKSIIVE